MLYYKRKIDKLICKQPLKHLRKIIIKARRNSNFHQLIIEIVLKVK